MQSSIVAGDTLSFTVTLADYPASAGWTLSYRLTPRAAGSAITFAATASGDDHQVDVDAATTAGWAQGSYTSGAWVSNGGGERYTVASEGGQVVIQPDPSALPAGTDTRSDAEIALANVSALLKGKAGSGVEQYVINGRQLRSYPLADLIKLEAKLRAEVNAERVAAGLQPSGGGVRRILVRMP